jgi:hypothetical protein
VSNLIYGVRPMQTSSSGGSEKPLSRSVPFGLSLPGFCSPESMCTRIHHIGLAAQWTLPRRPRNETKNELIWDCHAIKGRLGCP